MSSVLYFSVDVETSGPQAGFAALLPAPDLQADQGVL